MITWMQRHKKYLIITIWISTIAFVGAGFVGWGQYSYGDKAGAIAKVGNIEITMGELQKSYSNLYNQYSQMFQGEFDEEKAKSFGLKSQALQHLTQQALIQNLAKSYSLEISDAELLTELTTQDNFFKNGVFNKEIYKSVLSQNNLSTKEYEDELKKELLIKKTLTLLPINTNKNELNIFNTIISIADKIEYKVLTHDNIKINTGDDVLKPYWETKKQNFMTGISYDVKYVKQEKLTITYENAQLIEYYNDNKIHFKGEDAKILAFEDAKEKIAIELNEKDAKKDALRLYLSYKKNKLPDTIKVQDITISEMNNPFSTDVIEKISTLNSASPYLKPILVNGEYFIFELVKTNASQIKSFEDARLDIMPIYIKDEKSKKLLELAKNSLKTFKGTLTDFITQNDTDKIIELEKIQAIEFLSALFISQEKNGFINLKDGSIVLYNVMEQKLLNKTNIDDNEQIIRLKNSMFNEGLIKNLQKKYKIEIFIQGL
jgi:peptidyl-prolyl cis-trans isomerase D